MDEKILELGNERVKAEYKRRASNRKDIKKIVKLVLVPHERVFYDYYPFSFPFPQRVYNSIHSPFLLYAHMYSL